MKTYSQVFGEAAAESAARLAETANAIAEIATSMDTHPAPKLRPHHPDLADLESRIASLERAVASLLVRK